MNTNSPQFSVINGDPRESGGQATGHERPEQLAELGVTGKAFSVLEVVSGNPQPTGMAEIIRLTGMTKPTAHRVVTLLADMGFLERDASGRGFIEGASLVGLAHRTLAAAAPRLQRHSILAALSEEVGETSNYGVLSGGEVLYLDRVEAKWPLGLRFDAGSRVPAHCTAIGKLLLSRLPESGLRSVLESTPRASYTAQTLTDADALRAALDGVRREGIGVDDQEFMHGVVCIAVPVVDPEGDCFGGIAVSAPEARMTMDEMRAFLPQMKTAADRLARTYHRTGADTE